MTNSEFSWEFYEIMNVKCLEYCRGSNMRARLSVNWVSEKGPDLSRGKGLRGSFPPLNLSISDFLVHGKSYFLSRAEPLLFPVPTHWARIVSPQIPVCLIDNIPEVIKWPLSWGLVQLLCSVLHFACFWSCPRALTFFFFKQILCLFKRIFLLNQ